LRLLCWQQKTAPFQFPRGDLVRSPVARRGAVLGPAPDAPEIIDGECAHDAEPDLIDVSDLTQ
jgi:hypothetical protein